MQKTFITSKSTLKRLETLKGERDNKKYWNIVADGRKPLDFYDVV